MTDPRQDLTDVLGNSEDAATGRAVTAAISTDSWTLYPLLPLGSGYGAVCLAKEQAGTGSTLREAISKAMSE